MHQHEHATAAAYLALTLQAYFHVVLHVWQDDYAS